MIPKMNSNCTLQQKNNKREMWLKVWKYEETGVNNRVLQVCRFSVVTQSYQQCISRKVKGTTHITYNLVPCTW
jgi:hypothetical protein